MGAKGNLLAIPDYGDVTDPEVRAKYGYLEASVSIVGNILLFLLKLLLGLFINSIALIADAFHSLSDVGTSGVVIMGFKMAKKPPDEKHPFGHGRIEYISTLLIAILLLLTGLGFIQQSIVRLIDSIEIIDNEFTVIIGIIVIITAIVKELMAKFSLCIAKKIKSDILVGDAWHHRSDAFSSIVVGLSIIGSTLGIPYLDPIFGMVVAVIIIWIGVDLFRHTSNYLIGEAPDKETIDKIKSIADSVDELRGVHDINIHDYGTSKVISLHAEVDRTLKLEDAHRIADRLDGKLNKELGFSTIIHLDPFGSGYDKKMKRRMFGKILEGRDEIISFHKIQIIERGKSDDIKMHIIVDKEMSVDDSHELCHRIESIFQREYGTCNVDIHFEPCCKDCKICTLPCNAKND